MGFLNRVLKFTYIALDENDYKIKDHFNEISETCLSSFSQHGKQFNVLYTVNLK